MRHENPAALYRAATGVMPHERNAGPGFSPTLRGTILPVLRVIRRQLGLSTGDLLVLNALLSHLPCRDRKTGEEIPITQETMLVVFASNQALCARANGMDERVLRRHVGRLAEAGLVVRRSSASGKRFPLKHKGAIVDAFGIDLSPLLQRMQALHQMAEKETERQEEVRNLRARALAMRARLAAQTLCPEGQERLEDIRRTLRRTGLTPDDLRAIIDALEAELNDTAAPVETGVFAAANTPETTPQAIDRPTLLRKMVKHPPTPEMSGSDGGNVRLVESPDIEDKKPSGPDPEVAWRRCAELRSFYPDVDPTDEGLVRVIFEFGRMLNVPEHGLVQACHAMGIGNMLRALEYLAVNAARIARPAHYLERMMRDIEAGRRVGWA